MIMGGLNKEKDQQLKMNDTGWTVGRNFHWVRCKNDMKEKI